MRVSARTSVPSWRPLRAPVRSSTSRILRVSRRPASAVAGYYGEIGSAVDPESLFLTTGTSEAYAQVFKLLADPGRRDPRPDTGVSRFWTCSPGSRPFVWSRTCSRATVRRAGAIDSERLRASISTRTRAIVVVSPNNPTGSFLKRDELEECNALCRDFDCALIVDEVFSDYGAADDPRASGPRPATTGPSPSR